MPRKTKSPRRKNVKKNKRQKRSKVSRRRKQKGGVSPRTYMDRLAKATHIPRDEDIERQLDELGFTPRRSDSLPLSKEMEELGLGSRPPSLSLEDELALLEAEAGAGTSPLALASSSPRRFVSSSRPSSTGSTSSDDFVLVPRKVHVQQEAKRIGLFSGLFKRSAERKQRK